MTQLPEHLQAIKYRIEDNYRLCIVPNQMPYDLKILMSEVERLRDALEFYANEKQYQRIKYKTENTEVSEPQPIFSDAGTKAKEALNPTEGEVQ